jgi:hypothetical protein
MSQPILKIPNNHERQGFDTSHDGLRFLNRVPEFRQGLFIVGCKVLFNNAFTFLNYLDEVVSGGIDNEIHTWSYTAEFARKNYSFKDDAVNGRIIKIISNPSFFQFYSLSVDNIVHSWMANSNKIKSFYENQLKN